MNKIKMLAFVAASVSFVAYANDNDAYVPELWANEGLMILEESLVMSSLVHRDFSNQVAQFGDVVNTRKPRKFVSKRKVDTDSVTAQDATSDNVQVPLNQHHYNTFVIKDGESSKSFQELVSIYLKPAVQAVARGVDRSVAGQVHNFLAKGPTKRVGGLLTQSSSNVRSRIIDARQLMNVANVPEDQRRLLVSPTAESTMLNTDLFTKVNESGQSEALRNAQISRLFGFDIYAANNTPSSTLEAAEVVTGTVTGAKAAGAAAASTAVTVTAYEVQVGEWFTIAGNDQPMYATAVTASTNTTAITPNEANKNASGALAVLTVYKACDVQGAYAAGYSKEIILDGFVANTGPVAGRVISFGTGGSRKNYTIIEAVANSSTESAVLLDRPLEVGLSDNQLAFPAPAGDFNIAFHRDAIALVTRPLAIPRSSLGVMAAVASMGDLSMRVVMQYDSILQGTRVTVDMLSGVALLDVDMATLVLG